MKDEAAAGRRAGSANVAAGFAIILVVCAVGGYLVWPVLAEPVYLARSFFNRGCFAAPDEPAKLAGEAIFQQLPASASPVGGPATLQPCTQTGPGSESQIYGVVTVEYRSGLSDKEIQSHYETVARESGWAPEASNVRLLFAKKMARDRCLSLHVFHDPTHRPGSYRVTVAFWPKYQDHFCNESHPALLNDEPTTTPPPR
ncbi:hypothetical protein ACFOW4_00070 [Micromonospora sp. GCM10011542]|uniref:hypothetical protein n=1 Tax=Micromonospora sp. GCM10011542 TaxID=3317337 RepID=UPI00361A5272